MIDTREPVQGSLFDGPRRDAAIARVVGRAHPPLAAAEAARRAVLAQHKARLKDWADRGRAAMVHLYHEREAANVASHHGQAPAYVCGDDLTAWGKAAGFDGDPRALSAVFVYPKGFWVCIGRVKSARRNATLLPMWRPA